MRGARLFRLVAVALALVVALVFANRLFGRTLDPAGAVRAYLDAVDKGEAPPTCRNPPAVPDDFRGVDDYRIVRTTTSNASNQGTVEFDATRQGQTHTYLAIVVREGSTWKWCGIDPTGP